MKIIKDLKEIAEAPGWNTQSLLREYIKKLESGESKQRTYSQNRALHLGFRFISDHLNEIGKDIRVVLKPTVEIWWSPEAVKEYLFRPIMKAHTTKKSTTELNKLEVSQCWDIMFKFLSEKHEVEYIPFPHEEKKNETFEAQKMSVKLEEERDKSDDPDVDKIPF